MNWTALGWLLMLGAIWGASFLFIKIGVSQVGPMTFATARVLIGSALLYVFCRLSRAPWPRDVSIWRRFAVMGALGILVPFAAISWGTQFIPSGLSAILNASMPLFTVIIAMVWGDEGSSLTRVLGVLLGFLGIALLTWPKLQGGLQAALLGELAIILASLSYAIAIVYARGVLKDQPPLVASFGQVSMGCLFFLPLALLERPWTMSFSTEAIGAMVAIGALGTAVAYVLYYRLLQSVGATMTSIVTYIVPVFGVFWGRVILGERLSWQAFVALGLIFAGLGLIRRSPPHRTEPTKRTFVEQEGDV